MAPSWCNGFVQLNPYGQDAIELAVDLANARPSSAAELVERCEAAGVIFEDGTSAPDLTEVLEFLDHWAEVVDAALPERRAELLNALLAESTAHPRLTAHTGSWHIHYRDTLIPFARKLRALISSGTACISLAGACTGSVAARPMAATGSTPTPRATAGSATAPRLRQPGRRTTTPGAAGRLTGHSRRPPASPTTARAAAAPGR